MASLFGNEEKKKASIKKFLENEIEGSSREFDKAKKPEFNLLFRRTKPSNSLSLHLIMVKGFDYALRSAIVKGAPPAIVVYDTAANLVIDRALNHVKTNMRAVPSTDESADAVLSFKILQNDKIGQRFKENILE